MKPKASVLDLPDDLLNVIFSLLSVQCKQQAVQLTCKRWWQLLHNPRPGLWGDVSLNLDTHRQLLGRSRTTFRPAGEDLCRWLAARAPGISNLTLIGWFSGEDSHMASCSHRKFFDYHFGFIVGALQACSSALSLKLSGDSMFQSCVFQNMGFVKLLAPVLRHLRLTELESLIPDEHIAILCHMTGLEVLTIKSPEPRMLGGLMGLPDCIRQLTNLRRLELENQIRVRSLPGGLEGMTCLESLHIAGASLGELPQQLSGLASLTSLTVAYNHAHLQLSPGLSRLTNLERLELSACGLTAVPEAVAGMTALTALDMRVNRLACNGQDWCPLSLGALSRLAVARFSCCGIDSLSPALCSLSHLASLDLHSNFLEVLPPEFSKLTNLEYLDLSANRLLSVPEQLEGLLKLRVLKLAWQRPLPASARFKVERPLTFLTRLAALESLELAQTGSQAWDQVSLFHIGCAIAALGAQRRRPGAPYPCLQYIHSQYGE